MNSSRVTLLEKVKKGHRLYGGIYLMPDGRKVYLAYRHRKEIFRSGESYISDAVREGNAAWALDDATLLMLRARKIEFAGVLLKDTGDKWLIRTEIFFDRDKASAKNYSGRGGALQRYLPMQHFAFRRAPVKMPKR
ncbi:hypothetical protein ABID82_005084 [Methylobacterium sp. PvP062]|uniref:Uncharacterized protein n=1 Tax=Methylobacterium radiotolerans TaxID=31998 RepID=A0ABV2NU45_9HYPH|nr:MULTISPECIES: hypothetical protein [unclassified Methylobacterium]MBP2498398.1 hypothetical protein [Methylobacterium sp. PvP105]MBP2505782.1 hypothetical protein [Methylobacterium sp. PvP109]